MNVDTIHTLTTIHKHLTDMANLGMKPPKLLGLGILQTLSDAITNEVNGNFPDLQTRSMFYISIVANLLDALKDNRHFNYYEYAVGVGLIDLIESLIE